MPPAYLFDTDAISEVLKPRPAPAYVKWLATVPREQQLTSAVVVAELYKGAFKSPARDRWLTRIEEGILAGITVLPFDTGTARHCGAIRVDLEIEGRMPGEADLQIAATALQHGLVVVTGNVRHYAGVPGLAVSPVLVETRA